MEHMDGKIDMVAEQYGDIKKDINGIKETLVTHTEMIGNLAVNVVVVKEDVEVMKKDIEVMKGDIDITKKDVEVIKGDIEFIKTGLKKKVDIEEFSALERRVIALEKRR